MDPQNPLSIVKVHAHTTSTTDVSES